MFLQPVDQLIAFLKEAYADQFHAYYNGDPDLIPKFNLPCLSVVKLNDTNGNGATGLRHVTETLQIKIIYDKSDDMTAQDDHTDLTEKRIRDIVEARDPETGAYATNTLKHVLINRFTAAGYAVNDTVIFELGSVARPNDLETEEGHLTLTIDYNVPTNLGLDAAV